MGSLRSVGAWRDRTAGSFRAGPARGPRAGQVHRSDGEPSTARESHRGVEGPGRPAAESSARDPQDRGSVEHDAGALAPRNPSSQLPQQEATAQRIGRVDQELVPPRAMSAPGHFGAIGTLSVRLWPRAAGQVIDC